MDQWRLWAGYSPVSALDKMGLCVRLSKSVPTWIFIYMRTILANSFSGFYQLPSWQDQHQIHLSSGFWQKGTLKSRSANPNAQLFAADSENI
ncbi:hypothetical protein AVEN_220907-1, partial [Araneus ventricosus]